MRVQLSGDPPPYGILATADGAVALAAATNHWPIPYEIIG